MKISQDRNMKISQDRNMKIFYLLSLLALSVCTLIAQVAAEPDIESSNLKKRKEKRGRKGKGKGGGALGNRQLKNLKALDAIAEENDGDLSEGSAGLKKALDYIQAEFELLPHSFEVIEQPCKSMSPSSTYNIYYCS
jgi:hypothetical protein